MARWHRSPTILTFAAQWRERCLQGSGSMLTAKRLWTLNNLVELRREYQEHFHEGEGEGFLPRLRLQLGHARPVIQQLAAEVLWILYLSVSEHAMKGFTKRQQIAEIWELSGNAVPRNSPALGPVLDEGVANPNPGLTFHSWMEFLFVIDLACGWKTLGASTRGRTIDEPWLFAEWLDEQPEAASRQFRHMLLYLLFPQTFERVVSLRAKRRIVSTFLPRFGLDATAALRGPIIMLDRALLQIRPMLEERYRRKVVDYYEPPVREAWTRPSKSAGTNRRGSAGERDDVSYEGWHALTEIAEERRTISTAALSVYLACTSHALQRALREIALFCQAEGLPPLAVLVDTDNSIGTELDNVNTEEREVAAGEVWDFGWTAYGNPFGPGAPGAGYEELLARLLVDPGGAGDVLRTVRHRGRAQRLFRDALIRAYGRRCAFSGSTILSGLEAAHIVPWTYSTSSLRLDVRNGLLLTSWLHRLFDAGLISLDEDLNVQVQPEAIRDGSEFDREVLGRLQGARLRLPRLRKHHPDVSLIRERQRLLSSRRPAMESVTEGSIV